MKKNYRLIAFALSLIMLISALSAFSVFADIDNPIDADDLEPGAFIDVPKSAWFYDAVTWAQEKGYVAGVSKTEFAPMNNITRADFVTILGRFAKVNTIDYLGTYFDDVPTGKYYSAYVKWAAVNGIVYGVEKTLFAPSAKITREQLAAIFVRYAKYLNKKLPQSAPEIIFVDKADISDWALDSVTTAQRAGVISGDNYRRFNPKNNATRAEVCSMLMRFVTALDNSTEIKEKVVAAYYSAQGADSFTMSEADIKSIDFIFYNGLIADNMKSLTSPTFTPEDITDKKAINPDFKVLLAVAASGGNSVFYANTIENRDRAVFVDEIMEFVTDYGFDGVDIDWEFPESAFDKAANADLMKDLRIALDAQGKKDGKTYYLTAAVPATYWAVRVFDMDVLGEVCDYINIMNYDQNLSSPYTLSQCAPREDGTGLAGTTDSSAEGTVKTFIQSGLPAEKLLIGCGLYTIARTGVPENDKNGYGVYTGSGYNPSFATYHYTMIQNLIKTEGYVRYWQDTAKCPYLYNRNTGVFLTYDDDDSVKEKARIAVDYDVGGLMMFEYKEFYNPVLSLATSAKQWVNGNFSYPPAIDWSKV